MGFALRSSPDAEEDVLYVRRARDAAPVFEELSVVSLVDDVRSDDGGVIPAGSMGTIVAIWDGGSEYEVEFSEPVGTLMTVPGSKLRKV